MCKVEDGVITESYVRLSITISFTFLACDDQPVNHPPQMNEEELITSVELIYSYQQGLCARLVEEHIFIRDNRAALCDCKTL